MNIKKRFIAGAVCPKCQLMDKIVVYTVANKQFSECVRCGFRQDSDEHNKKEPKIGQKIFWLKRE